MRGEAQISGCEHDKAELVIAETAAWLGSAMLRSEQRKCRPGRLSEHRVISSKGGIGRAGERA